LKILILTTDTYHHLFFTREIKKKYKNLSIVLEKKINKFSFRTHHKIIIEIKKFEKKYFFKNKDEKFINEKIFNNINDANCIKHIKKIKPDVIISFGIGLMKPKFLNNFKDSKIVNLHGGDIQHYRGLDSHMWSIYHNDFKSLITTLHYVNKKIDSGNIIFKKKILINSRTKFVSIRALNTIICVKLVLKFLRLAQVRKKIKTKKIYLLGRYYSAIPEVLFKRCIKNYQKYIKKI
tara:strand:- start:682 stop:1386 length:705 start_codon:yes stop_codon:yes gene_type:complete